MSREMVSLADGFLFTIVDEDGGVLKLCGAARVILDGELIRDFGFQELVDAAAEESSVTMDVDVEGVRFAFSELGCGPWRAAVDAEDAWAVVEVGGHDFVLDWGVVFECDGDVVSCVVSFAGDPGRRGFQFKSRPAVFNVESSSVLARLLKRGDFTVVKRRDDGSALLEWRPE